jgi:predicted kinase
LNENYKSVFTGMDLSLVSNNRPQLVVVNTRGSLEQVLVTADNARDTLTALKIADNEKRAGHSYALRHEILKRSQGALTTHEIYVYTSELPRGEDLYPFLNNPGNWLPERNALHDAIIQDQYALTEQLSERLNDTRPTVYALRGNTASGKSTLARRHPQLARGLDEHGELSGSINPDTYKNILKQHEAEGDMQVVSHAQTHFEGAMIAHKIESMIAPEASSVVIDRRLTTIDSINAIQAHAQQYWAGKPVHLFDLDVPLETSLMRVLARPVGGDAPNVSFDVIAEGFTDIRRSRNDVLKRVASHDEINYYTLIVTDENDRTIEVARKEPGGHLEIAEGTDELLEEAREYRYIRWTVRNLIATILSEDYINRYVGRLHSDDPHGSAAETTRASLARYIGRTLKQALDERSHQLNE